MANKKPLIEGMNPVRVLPDYLNQPYNVVAYNCSFINADKLRRTLTG
jgi:hypothetical protein